MVTMSPGGIEMSVKGPQSCTLCPSRDFSATLKWLVEREMRMIKGGNDDGATTAAADAAAAAADADVTECRQGIISVMSGFYWLSKHGDPRVLGSHNVCQLLKVCQTSSSWKKKVSLMTILSDNITQLIEIASTMQDSIIYVSNWANCRIFAKGSPFVHATSSYPDLHYQQRLSIEYKWQIWLGGNSATNVQSGPFNMAINIETTGGISPVERSDVSETKIQFVPPPE